MRVEILPYDKEAPKIFEDFRKFLQKIIPYEITIEHIGSTAVHGVGGKNVIDVMIITEKENMKKVLEILESKGFRHNPGADVKPEKIFASGEYEYKGKEGHIHIHITYHGSNEHVDKILFRDYLRNHPEEARRYYELKKKWSNEAGEEPHRYTQLKTDYIKGILKRLKGINIFGKAYKIMLQNDPHPSNCVDRMLFEKMVLLCKETHKFLYSTYTPLKILYEKGKRPVLEEYLKNLIKKSKTQEGIIRKIANFTSSIENKFSGDINSVIVGGKEEDIIKRGTFWCTDIARVACALYQIAGFPSRIVYLVNPDRAYSGHAIVEVYRGGKWGAIDPLTSVVYFNEKPVSVWELMKNPKLILKHSKGKNTPYTTPEQFKMAAISNYFIWEDKKYNYTEGKINNYYRSILEMAEKGWPGGLRWLHREDL